MKKLKKFVLENEGPLLAISVLVSSYGLHRYGKKSLKRIAAEDKAYRDNCIVLETDRDELNMIRESGKGLLFYTIVGDFVLRQATSADYNKTNKN